MPPLRWAFEISDWRDDSRQIIEFLMHLKDTDARMVGFNNLGFDYPVLHTLIRQGQGDSTEPVRQGSGDHQFSGRRGSRWNHLVYERPVGDADRPVQDSPLRQRARSTSLKVLEFNMRADNIEDLPFPFGTSLTREQAEVLKRVQPARREHDQGVLSRERPMIRSARN
jgi:hypothetical protein